MLALTFDDGPDPRGTPMVLDALAAAGVKATFFVLGERVDDHPELLKRVLDAGHDVQVHGYLHLRHPGVIEDEVVRDLDRALEALAKHGVHPWQWRIPWGDLAEFTPRIASERGLELVGWTADTHDWRGDDVATMLAGVALSRGAIVLGHDGVGPGARRKDARATADLIGLVVARARELELEPGPVQAGWPVAIPAGNPELPPRVDPRA
jgi:peptidoglycan/xylan/chitin deacetylase (PgdA/CDA1 family)